MKIKVFDVVKLKNGDKATIIGIKNNCYKVAIVDSRGIAKGQKDIIEHDIVDIIYTKESFN
ncbi:MAG: hypothetical protein J6J60_00840 [Clostridia bacterium]|nr:hypothetical protein [Clostridia bacterium]